MRIPDPPLGVSKTPSSMRRIPTNVGEHSVEVLGEAGFCAAAIEAMIADGITGTFG